MYNAINDRSMVWCQKVLPLVYEDSLSYYEQLCKIGEAIRDILADELLTQEDIQSIKAELVIVQKWIADFDTAFVENLVQEYITKVIKAVSFGLSSAGYFMAIIPDNWSEISFGTIQTGELYGHLTLSYD